MGCTVYIKAKQMKTFQKLGVKREKYNIVRFTCYK